MFYYPRGQIKNERGQDDGIQDDDNIPFKSSDLNKLIHDNHPFCDTYSGSREIYYTSGPEDKEQLDVVMDRVRNYLDFICNEIDSQPRVPGDLIKRFNNKTTRLESPSRVPFPSTKLIDQMVLV